MKAIFLIMIILIISPAYAQKEMDFTDYVQSWFKKRNKNAQKGKKFSLITKPGEKNNGDFKLFCWLGNGQKNPKFYDLSIKYFVIGLTTYDVRTSKNKIITVPIDNCFIEEQ